MSDIYGQLIEYPPLSGKFVVEIRPHEFEKPKRRRDAAGKLVTDPFCGRCGFHRVSPIHPGEKA